MIMPARRRVSGLARNYRPVAYPLSNVALRVLPGRRVGPSPASITGLSGLRLVRGLGACDPRDVACVAAQGALSVANQTASGQQVASGQYDQCIANGNSSSTCGAWYPSGYTSSVPFTNLTPQQQADAMMSPTQAATAFLTSPQIAGQLQQYGINPLSLVPSVPSLSWGGSGGGISPTPYSGGSSSSGGGASYSGGTLSFTNSRGSNTLQPGDTWTVKITGATPNQGVNVRGGVNGASDVTSMGTTDGAGNFTLSGRIDSSQVGNWRETWSVGGQVSGSFAFVVVPTPAAGSGAPAGTSSSGAPAGGSGAPAGGSSSASSSISQAVSSFSFGSLPTWAWLVGGGAVLYFAFGRK